MGKVSLVLTSVGFFALFLINPVGMFINRRLHSWQESGAARHYLTRYVGYLLLVASIAAVGVSGLYKIGIVNFGMSVGWLILLISGSLLFNTINQTAISSINLLGDSRRFVLLSLATIVASFIFAALLVKLVQPFSYYWLLGLLLGQSILGVVGTRMLFSRLQKAGKVEMPTAFTTQHLQTLLNFAWPVAIAAGLGWVQGQGYRYLIEGRLGLAQLGIFVVGYGISAGLIAGFESVLTTYFQPRLYRDVNVDQHPERRAEAWQRYAAAVIPSLVLTVALIIMLAPELARIFLGKNFQSAADFVIWGALAEGARVLTGVYSLIAHVYMRTRRLIFPGLIGAFLSVTLCALLLPVFGAAGAGIGLALSGFAVVVTMHFLLARQVGGGTPIRPVLLAGACSGILWAMTLGLHHLWGGAGWGPLFGVLMIVGITYLGLGYLFLRQHLAESIET